MARTIGLIGLGLMGQGFAARLLANGCRVVGTDIDAGARNAATARGVAVVSEAADVADAADLIFICVTTSAAVDRVVRGEGGLLSRTLAGKTVVDLSTTEISLTHELAAALAEAGAGFVDAPVSGGPGAAEGGTLAVMAGGTEADVAAALPVLRLFGSVAHMGGPGAGQATKLVNQTLVIAGTCVIAEATRLAQAYGVDPLKVPEALADGYGGSALLSAIMPRMANEDFAPRGYARQVQKDLEMLHAATKDVPLAMPMVSQALTLYRLLAASGRSELDNSAVVTLYPQPERST